MMGDVLLHQDKCCPLFCDIEMSKGKPWLDVLSKPFELCLDMVVPFQTGNISQT